jgi:hypothetical protein
MEHQLGNIPRDKPQFVETSDKTARYSLYFGIAFLLLSLSWFALLFHPAFDEYDDLLRGMNFGSFFGLAIVYIGIYFSYSKPNLMLHWDRLVIHSFHSRGVIMLRDVIMVTTGYTIHNFFMKKNQTICMNDWYTRKNKIIIKIQHPVPFLIGAFPLQRTKLVDEIVIDVLDPDKFAWNLYMRNPAIVFERSSPVIKTYKSPTPLAEMRARI